MIHELNHFGIVIRNLEKSLAFYQDLLGAKVVYRGLIPAPQTDVVYLLITGRLPTRSEIQPQDGPPTATP